jgi:hypothetical protein
MLGNGRLAKRQFDQYMYDIDISAKIFDSGTSQPNYSSK